MGSIKAMIAEWNIRGHVTTHHMQRRHMSQRHVAPDHGWSIWIGRFISDPTKPVGQRYHPLWESHPFLLLSDKLAARRTNEKATYFNSQSSTQVLGHLFIQTLRSPMPNLIPRWRFAPPDGGTLFRIWPRSQVSVAWPGQTMTDLDAIYTTNAFMKFVLQIQAQQGIS